MQTGTETGPFALSERQETELEDLVDKIKLCAKDVIESSHDALKSAITAGGHLVSANKRVIHGKWGSWLKQNFEFSQGTASNWMRLWKHKTEILDLAKDDKDGMSVNRALQLVAEPANQLTELEKIEKKCFSLTAHLWNLPKGSESRKSRPILAEHMKEIRKFVKERTR